jgi:hypothetical protein
MYVIGTAVSMTGTVEGSWTARCKWLRWMRSNVAGASNQETLDNFLSTRSNSSTTSAIDLELMIINAAAGDSPAAATAAVSFSAR